MSTVTIVMLRYDEGFEVWHSVDSVYKKRAAADHHRAVLEESNKNPRVTYYCVDWSVQ